MSTWPERWRLGVVWAVSLSACGTVTPPSGGEQPQAVYQTSARSGVTVRSMNGDDVSEADAFRSMVNLAQAIAIALQDESLRIRVYGALHASPFPEHKIHLRPFTQQGVGAVVSRKL